MIVEFLDAAADNGDDMVNLYINPADLSDPLAGGPELANITLGEVYQSTSTRNLVQFLLWPNLDGSAAGAGDEGNVIYDEFRLGSSATAVSRAAARAEPVTFWASFMILILGICANLSRAGA